MQEHESPLVDARFLRGGGPSSSNTSLSIKLPDNMMIVKRMYCKRTRNDIETARVFDGKRKKTRYLRSCQHCQQKCWAASPDANYCSRKCALVSIRAKEKAMLSSGPCSICGKTAVLGHVSLGLRVCTLRCASIHYSRMKRPTSFSLSEYLQQIGRDALCVVCGSKYVKKRIRHACCSSRCYAKYFYHKKQKYENAKKLNAFRNALNNEQGECTICGTPWSEIKTRKELGLVGFGDSMKSNLDHILPRALGGGNVSTNLRRACWACNQLRSSMDHRLDYAIAAASRAFWDALDRLPPEIALAQEDLYWGSKSPVDIPVSRTELAKNTKDGVN